MLNFDVLDGDLSKFSPRWLSVRDFLSTKYELLWDKMFSQIKTELSNTTVLELYDPLASRRQCFS